MKPRFNHEFINGFVPSVLKPGAVVVSCGARGGGKTHCAVSYCQALMEGRYGGVPEHVSLLTNVIFVRRRDDGGFDTASPPGVRTVTTMREVFPLAADLLEEHGRKGALTILLLDEAQNFLLGEMNGEGGLGRSMKVFCGILRKFNMMLWLITPAMRNLGPAFRNFIDADSDPANVTCTFEKDPAEARRFLARNGYDYDYRSVVFVSPGAHERTLPLPVPETSWTRDPETLSPGEYAYDTFSSADFRLGDGFPFGDFVYAVSGRSSYEMVRAIRDFYASLEEGEENAAGVSDEDREAIERAYRDEVAWRMYTSGFTHKQIGQAFGVTDRTSRSWISRMKEEGRAVPAGTGPGKDGDPPSASARQRLRTEALASRRRKEGSDGPRASRIYLS